MDYLFIVEVIITVFINAKALNWFHLIPSLNFGKKSQELSKSPIFACQKLILWPIMMKTLRAIIRILFFLNQQGNILIFLELNILSWN